MFRGNVGKTCAGDHRAAILCDCCPLVEDLDSLAFGINSKRVCIDLEDRGSQFISASGTIHINRARACIKRTCSYGTSAYGIGHINIKDVKSTYNISSYAAAQTAAAADI